MLEIRNVLILGSIIGFCRVESCQPELVEGATDLVSVGYDRRGSRDIYVDTVSVGMKNKHQFTKLLAPGCNGRNDATVAIAIRKADSEEWKEMVNGIRIKKRDTEVKNLDPCLRYEVRVSIIPNAVGLEIRSLPVFTVGRWAIQ